MADLAGVSNLVGPKGKPAVGTVERLSGLAKFLPVAQGDTGAECKGSAEIWWDDQRTAFGPNRGEILITRTATSGRPSTTTRDPPARRRADRNTFTPYPTGGPNVSSPYEHALSAAKRFGGRPEEHLPLHEFLDSSKPHFPDLRHRAALHHGFGVQVCERVFGPVFRLECGRELSVRTLAERHILEDLGTIPTLADWLRHTDVAPWMRKAGHRGREVRVRLPVPTARIDPP
jgi:hypothetical protein